jgi:hypothetical protein
MSVFQFGYHTETAGTVITELIPPAQSKIPRITDLVYICAGTAHTLTFMRAVATTTTTAIAAASQAVVAFTATNTMKDSAGAAETIAASDYVVYETTGGGYELNTVASVASLNVTMNTNVAVAVPSGATIWIFGEVGRAVHQTHLCTASVSNDLKNRKYQGGLPLHTDLHNARSGENDPMIFYSNNATAAGKLDSLTGTYVSQTDITTT